LYRVDQFFIHAFHCILRNMTDGLFSPLRIRSIELRNRIAVSPMCQYSGVDGMPTDWHFVHLGSRAIGGAAIVMVEATWVEPHGRISTADLGIWKDEQIASFEKIARFIKSAGAIPAIQLGHAGRKASTDVPWRGGHPLTETQGAWKPMAPSAIPFSSA